MSSRPSPIVPPCGTRYRSERALRASLWATPDPPGREPAGPPNGPLVAALRNGPPLEATLIAFLCTCTVSILRRNSLRTIPPGRSAYRDGGRRHQPRTLTGSLLAQNASTRLTRADNKCSVAPAGQMFRRLFAGATEHELSARGASRTPSRSHGQLRLRPPLSPFGLAAPASLPGRGPSPLRGSWRPSAASAGGPPPRGGGALRARVLHGRTGRPQSPPERAKSFALPLR